MRATLAKQVAVDAAQGGAGDDGGLAAALLAGDPVADGLEPGPAVLVGERHPCFIFSTLASGWKASPSANSQPRTVDRPFATVLLPLPETPMTTTMSQSAPPGRTSLSAMVDTIGLGPRVEDDACSAVQPGSQAGLGPGRSAACWSAQVAAECGEERRYAVPSPGRVGVPHRGHGELVDGDCRVRGPAPEGRARRSSVRRGPRGAGGATASRTLHAPAGAPPPPTDPHELGARVVRHDVRGRGPGGQPWRRRDRRRRRHRRVRRTCPGGVVRACCRVTDADGRRGAGTRCRARRA